MQGPKHLRAVGEGHEPSDELVFAARESVELSMIPMLTLAERRITEAELDQLDELIATLPDNPDWPELQELRIKYWTLLASASRNTILQRQLLWWMRSIGDLEARFEPWHERAGALPTSSYRGLTRALRQRRGAVEYWLKALEPLLEASEARLGIGLQRP